MNMDAGMHHAKDRGNKEIPLAVLSRIPAQSCVTLCLNYVGRVTHDYAKVYLRSVDPRKLCVCVKYYLVWNAYTMLNYGSTPNLELERLYV